MLLMRFPYTREPRRLTWKSMRGFLSMEWTWAYETDDSLSRVYSFYSSKLEEGGFEAPGSMSIGNGSHFTFHVSKGGSEVAMINGTVEEGKTYIVIIGLSGR